MPKLLVTYGNENGEGRGRVMEDQLGGYKKLRKHGEP